MAWTAPRTWVVGEMATAALLNAHVRDNLLALSTHVHDGSQGDGATLRFREWFRPIKPPKYASQMLTDVPR